MTPDAPLDPERLDASFAAHLSGERPVDPSGDEPAWAPFLAYEPYDDDTHDDARARVALFVERLIAALAATPLDTLASLECVVTLCHAVREVRSGDWGFTSTVLKPAWEHDVEATATVAQRLADASATLHTDAGDAFADAKGALGAFLWLPWLGADGSPAIDASVPAAESLLARASVYDYALEVVYFAASRWRARLVALADRAVTDPAFASRWVVMGWVRKMVYDERPSGLKTAAKALAKVAARWPDDAFDAFLGDAILPTDSVYEGVLDETTTLDGRAHILRRQPDRRAVIDALHALGRDTPGARSLARLHAAAHGAPAAAPAPETDPGLITDLGLRMCLLGALREQGVLPAFDPYAVAAAVESREIDLESEGYDGPVPELVAAYTAPALTAERLAQLVRFDAEFGAPPVAVVLAVFPHDDGEDDRPFVLETLAGLEHCTAVTAVGLFGCDDVYDRELDLTPVLALPALAEAHLDVEPTPEARTVVAALQGRGVAVAGSVVAGSVVAGVAVAGVAVAGSVVDGSPAPMTNPFRTLFGRAAPTPVTLDPAGVGEDEMADARSLDASFATPDAFDGETLGRFWDAFLDASLGDAAARDRRADLFLDRLIAHVDAADQLDRLFDLVVRVRGRVDLLERPTRHGGFGAALDRRADDVADAFRRHAASERALGLGQEAGAACETTASTLAYFAYLADAPRAVAAFADPLEDYLAQTPGLAVWPSALFTDGPDWRVRLVRILDRVLGGPDPGGRDAMLSHARQMLYHQPPDGLANVAPALAQAAAGWPDDAFDDFLRDAVLPRGDADALAVTEALRAEPERRAVVDALHALGRATPGADALARLHAAAHAVQPTADPGLDLGLRLCLLDALRRQQLVPPFDAFAFAAAYEGREIDLEEEGWDAPVPELLAACTAPPLTPERLARLKTLVVEFGGPPVTTMLAVYPNMEASETPRPLHVARLDGIERCTSLRELCLVECFGVYGPDPDWSALARLPALERARLDLDDTPANRAVARALRARGVAVTGTLATTLS